jgi:hypothetical protein
LEKLKVAIGERSKAIGAGVGALASFIVTNLTGHDINPVWKAAIITAGAALVTYFFPKNTETPPVGIPVGPQS